MTINQAISSVLPNIVPQGLLIPVSLYLIDSTIIYVIKSSSIAESADVRVNYSKSC